MILFRKNGTISYSQIDIRYFNKSDYNKFKIVKDPIKVLGEHIVLEKGVIFKTIMDFIFSNIVIFDKIFASQLNDVSLSEFMLEINKKGKSKYSKNKLAASWVNNFTSDWVNGIDFHMYGGMKVDKVRGIVNNNKSINHIPLYDIKDCEVIIDNSYKIWNLEAVKYTEHFIDITFYDFIGAILKNITTFGTPVERDEQTLIMNEIITKRKQNGRTN
jgi:hypothetical protein